MARLGAGVLGIAVLFGGGTLPALGAEPAVPEVPVQTPADDPTPTESAPATDPTPLPNQPAAEEASPEPVEAPTPTTEPVAEPSPDAIEAPSAPKTTDPVTSSPAAPSTVIAPATVSEEPTYVVTVDPDPAVGCYGSRATLGITVAPIPQGGGTVSLYRDSASLWTVDLDATGWAQVEHG